MLYKEKTEVSVLVIEEEGVPWYCDIMKFLELGICLDGADKREWHSIRMMAMQYIICGVSSIGDPMMVYTLVV